MFWLLSKNMRKMKHGIVIHPWNIILFMANLSIYLNVLRQVSKLEF